MINDNSPPTAIERLSVARWSSDLTLKKFRCDVDLLIGAGMAALRTSPGAASLVKLRLSLDVSAWAAALDRATHLTQRLAYKDDWKLEDNQIKALAKAALKHWLVPVCPKCSGQRFEEIAGTHRLGKTPCKVCHGTGERPLPKDTGRQLRAILYLLDQDQANVGSALRGVMK